MTKFSKTKTIFLTLLLFGVFSAFKSANFAQAFIVIDPSYPHSFKFDNGERYFPMGDTAYYLLGQGENTIREYIDSRSAHGFNFIRMGAIGWGFWPFGGTPASPDYTQINQSAMQKMDRVFDYAESKDMNIELILWTYDAVNGDNQGGQGLWGNTQRENFWVDTVVNRYKSRHNLFMYTVANEFERYPNGIYSYDSNDVEWVKRIADRIRVNDATHPISAHPSSWISDIPPSNSFHSYGGFTQRLPQVVWPLWENSNVNILNMQNNQGVQNGRWAMPCPNGHSGCADYVATSWEGINYPATWTATGWDMEGPGMEDSIAEDWSHGKPVINTEFGYQFETGGENYGGVLTRQVHQPSTVRKKAWKIATVGGYFSAGFDDAAVTIRDFTNWRPGQLKILYDFFTNRTEYWKMAPHLELVASHNSLLALPGVEYVAYFPRGGTNYVNLKNGAYSVEWLNPETGIYTQSQNIFTTGENYYFTPPDSPGADWVLHLKLSNLSSAPARPSGITVR